MKLKPEEFVKYCWKLGKQYISGVEDGSIITNKWIKLAVSRHISDLKRKDLIYNVDSIERVFKFLSFINISHENTYQQFPILPYQVFIIMNLFGFYVKKTLRRKYRYAFLFVSRKSGKTSFASALQLYGLVGDGVVNPQSLLVANNREQASIALGFITSMVNHSPAMSKRLQAQRYRIIPKDPNDQGFCKTLASNSSRLDGWSASMCIIDELHEAPDDSIFNVMKSSTGARENPLIFLVSTAGFSLNSFCYDLTEYGKNILKGDVKDDTMFPLLYTLDEEDDVTNVNNWYKSNPALGVINHIEDLELEFNQAQHRGSQMANFATKHLNLYVESEMAWIPEHKLKPVCRKVDEEELLGLPCYAGLDLSSTRDLTSLVLVFKKDGKFKVIPYFFMVNNPEKLLRPGGIDIKRWIGDGHIIQCKSETIDYDLIKDTIMELSAKFDIQKINYDQFNSALIVPKLIESGIHCESFHQTAQKFNEPLKYIEKLIYDDDIDLSDNPAMLWNMRNVVLWIDGNGNIKIMKNKSKDSVDGSVSLGMAMGAYIDYHKYDYDS